MPEILFPGIGFDQVSPVAKIFDRAFELWTARQHDGCAHLGDGDLAQLLDVRLERVAQLA